MAIERVKNHFEDEAKEFDAIIQRLIPNYNEMIAALVSVIPFSKESIFSMIDLGCGTGTYRVVFGVAPPGNRRRQAGIL